MTFWKNILVCAMFCSFAVAVAGCDVSKREQHPTGYLFGKEESLGPDKLAHFGAGVVSAAVAEAIHPEPFTLAGTEIPSGCVASFAVGVGKELYDDKVAGTYFEGMDLVATTAGCFFTWEWIF